MTYRKPDVDLCFASPTTPRTLKQLDYCERNLMMGILHKFADTEENLRNNAFELKDCDFGRVWVIPALFTVDFFVTIRNHRLEIIDVKMFS